MSLNFAQVPFKYVMRSADGSAGATTAAGWDFLRRVPFEPSGSC